MRRQNISLRGAESVLPPCTMAQELLSPLALQLQLGWEEENWQGSFGLSLGLFLCPSFSHIKPAVE